MGNTYELYQLKDSNITKNNVYIIADRKTKKAAIIDPACSSSQIRQLLKRYQLKLGMILITHAHEEHICSVQDLIELYNVPVYISKLDAEYFHCKWDNMIFVEDGDRILLGNTLLTAIFTPGHSPGSMCYLTESSIFTGDTIFIEGCGFCSRFGTATDDLFHSIQVIKKKIRNSVQVYPGHTYKEEPGATMECLKKYNIYFSIEDKEQFWAFRHRKNQKNLFDFY